MEIIDVDCEGCGAVRGCHYQNRLGSPKPWCKKRKLHLANLLRAEARKAKVAEANRHIERRSVMDLSEPLKRLRTRLEAARDNLAPITPLSANLCEAEANLGAALADLDEIERLFDAAGVTPDLPIL